MNSGKINHLCGRGDWGFSFSAAVSSAVRIICCWDKKMFEASECVFKQRFVAVKGRCHDNTGPQGLICVYAPTDDNDRRTLFDYLYRFVMQWDYDDYTIFGDFNVVMPLGREVGCEWVQIGIR